MKQKFLLIKMLWRVIRNKENGWIFFKVTEQQQIDFINNKSVYIEIRYVGVDKEFVSKVSNKLSN